MIKPKRPRKCAKCTRRITEKNKSGLCYVHVNLKKKKERYYQKKLIKH